MIELLKRFSTVIMLYIVKWNYEGTTLSVNPDFIKLSYYVYMLNINCDLK